MAADKVTAPEKPCSWPTDTSKVAELPGQTVGIAVAVRVRKNVGAVTARMAKFWFEMSKNTLPEACTLMRAVDVEASEAGRVRTCEPSLGVPASNVVG